MGYAITWCAVREEVAEQLLTHLGFSLTGEIEEDVPEARFSTAKLPTGWRVIWSNRHACPILLKGIPTFGHEVVLCQIEEHVMASSAELWSSGARTWWISHEGESGPKGLEITGALPQCLASIQHDMNQMQRAEGGDSAQVDYIFEIPLKVAQALVGFKHDEYDAMVNRYFKVLSRSKSAQGFFARLCRFTGLVLSLSLSACTGSQSAAQKNPSNRAWLLVSTEHFRVYSDLDGPEVEALAASLERDLSLIAQAAFRSPSAIVEPTDVVVFAKAAHFHRYFSKSLGGVAYTGLPLLPERRHTVVTSEEFSSTMSTTLRHELVHDVYARNFGAAPPWLSEGFAEYFSTVRLVNGQIHIGAALPDLALTEDRDPFAVEKDGIVVAAIPRTMIPPPSALLKMSPDEFYAEDQVLFEGDTPSFEMTARYFGAWAFVHFLLSPNSEYSRRFARFLTVVPTASVEHAWQQAFAGVNMNQLDEDFRSYLADGQLTVSALPYQQPTIAPSSKVRALDEGEKHVLLAKLTLAQGLSLEEKSVFSSELDAAVHAALPTSEAYYLRGMFAVSEGKYAEAQRDIESALRLTPDDPRALRASLELQLRQLGDTLTGQQLEEIRPPMERLEGLARSAPELLFVAHYFAAIREEQRALALGIRAITLNPTDPVALSGYAQVLEVCGRLELAVTTQRRAIEFLYEHRELHGALRDELKRMETLLSQQKQQTTAIQPVQEEPHAQ